jgi:hypothetical protein
MRFDCADERRHHFGIGSADIGGATGSENVRLAGKHSNTHKRSDQKGEAGTVGAAADPVPTLGEFISGK